MVSKRVGVISNPRSGTSLMVRLLILGFDLTDTLPLFPHLEGKDVYEYRATPEDLHEMADSTYKVIHIIRDPRSVITSKHPSSEDKFMVDFKEWEDNYNYSRVLAGRLHVCQVKYEELVVIPNKVQSDISKSLDLRATSPFSMCAREGTAALRRWEELSGEMGTARDLDQTRAVRWRLPNFKVRIKEQLHRYPQLPDVLVELGYEDTLNWTKEYYV